MLGRNRATGPPDFIGIGAESAGLRWWYRLLLEHRAIRPPQGEHALRFFSQHWTHEMTEADVAGYHARFPRRRGTIVGECSPRYLFLPWTPPLIARAAPDAKLLVMLCDPIERYRARIAHERLHLKSANDVPRMGIAAAHGRYASQLRTLTRFVDRDRVLVLQSEKCKADLLGEYARTLRFLGVRDTVPRRVRRRAARPPAPAERAELWPDIETSLHEEFDDEVREAAALVPELDLRLWPNFSQLAASERPAPQRRGG
jgi:hypothetical protein